VANQITLNWSSDPLATLYQVEVYPTGTPAGQECTVANHHCPAPSALTNYTFTIDAGVSSYTWRVRGINTNCGVNLNGPWSAPFNFIITGTITGTFYQDNGNTATLNAATGLCQSASASPFSPDPGTTIKAIWGGNTTLGSITGSTYTINGVGVTPNTQVTVSPAGGYYTCSCPVGCSYSGLTAPKVGVPFYLSFIPIASWWQTANAYIFAGATSGKAIQSQIPFWCASSGSCTAAVSQYDTANTAGSDGTSLSAGGSIDSTSDPNTQYSYLNESGTDTHVEGLTLNGPREDYSYFSQLYGINTGNTVDFSGNQPGAAPANGNAYYANSSVTINNPWNVAAGQSIVVFVNGDLTIKAPIIAANGSFLAFIVKGNITFDKTLGSLVSNAPVAEGIFVCDGQIITQSYAPGAGDDLKFVGQGTFVGWNGIQLQRDFNNLNAPRARTEPVESFSYRPDFMYNVPDKMIKPLLLWQETN